MKKSIIILVIISALSAGCTRTQKENFKDKLLTSFANATLGPDLASQVSAANADYKAQAWDKATQNVPPTNYPISHKVTDQAYAKLSHYIVELKNVQQKPNTKDAKQAGVTKQVDAYVKAQRLCPGIHAQIEPFEEPIPLYDPVAKTARILVMCIAGLSKSP